jgi:hypothetical protein
VAPPLQAWGAWRKLRLLLSNFDAYAAFLKEPVMRVDQIVSGVYSPLPTDIKVAPSAAFSKQLDGENAPQSNSDNPSNPETDKETKACSLDMEHSPAELSTAAVLDELANLPRPESVVADYGDEVQDDDVESEETIAEDISDAPG